MKGQAQERPLAAATSAFSSPAGGLYSASNLEGFYFIGGLYTAFPPLRGGFILGAFPPLRGGFILLLTLSGGHGCPAANLEGDVPQGSPQGQTYIYIYIYRYIYIYI